MGRPTAHTVLRAIERTPVVIKRTVWDIKRVKALGKKYRVKYRNNYFGYYNRDTDTVVLGRMKHRKQGQARELVATHVHEILHKVRPEWSEDVVTAMELQYLRSGAIREASSIKLLNLTYFGRDIDAEADRPTVEGWLDALQVGEAKAVHAHEAPQDRGEVGQEVRETAAREWRDHERGLDPGLQDQDYAAGAGGLVRGQSRQAAAQA